MVSSANAGAANMVAAAANKQIRFIHSSLCAPAPAAANAPPRPVGDSLLALSFLAESAPRIGKKIAQSARESHADRLPQSRLSGRPMSPEAAACGRSIGSLDVHLLRWKPDHKPKMRAGDRFRLLSACTNGLSRSFVAQMLAQQNAEPAQRPHAHHLQRMP